MSRADRSRREPRYLVRARMDKMGCVVWRVDNDKMHAKLKRLCECSLFEHDDECLIQFEDDIKSFVPARHMSNLYGGWTVRFFVSDTEVETRYGIPL